MEITIRKTDDAPRAHAIARMLPEFFDAGGLVEIERDTKEYTLFGAYDGERMVGFVVYKEIDPVTVEMLWLGVMPGEQGRGVGMQLVEETLALISERGYQSCRVKTLADTDPYEPYKKTRAFYRKLGFVSVEIIDPYPAWGENACQIFSRSLGSMR